MHDAAIDLKGEAARLRAILIGSVGNLVEWYDIGKLFQIFVRELRFGSFKNHFLFGALQYVGIV